MCSMKADLELYDFIWPIIGLSDHIAMRVCHVVSVLSISFDTLSFSTRFCEFIILMLTHSSNLSSHDYHIQVAQLDTHERTHTARVTPN